MGCSCLFFLLVIPIFAVLVSTFSFISITFFILLIILLSKPFFLNFSKQKPIMVHASKPSSEKSLEEVGEILSKIESIPVEKELEDQNGEGYLIKSLDLYSENESTDRFSCSSSEGRFSDAEWPYNVAKNLDSSDDSISDEESLFEIEIPRGDFVKKDSKFNLKKKYCKLSAGFSVQKQNSLDFLTDMNEEDNLIEIDIYMGSIKYSSYEI